MQAVGIKTALACILFGFSSLGPGGHFHADEGVSLRRDAGGHFAAEFPPCLSARLLESIFYGRKVPFAPVCIPQGPASEQKEARGISL